MTARHDEDSGATSSPRPAMDVSRLFLFVTMLGVYAILGIFLSIAPLLYEWLCDFVRRC